MAEAVFLAESNRATSVSGRSTYDSSTLNLRDLETGNDTAFTCDSDERLQPIGFIDSDLVYGVAKVSDIDTEDKGSEVFPMYKVLIVN